MYGPTLSPIDLGGGDGGGNHALIDAFATESGATDLTALNTLIEQIDSFGWLSNFVIYPQKQDQNANAGATIYSLGSLTNNNGTLVGSPTRNADHIAYNGTSQAMRISDFLTADTLTVWLRCAQPILPSLDAYLISQYDTGSNQRSIALLHDGDGAGDPYRLVRSANGSLGPGAEQYDSAGGLHDTDERMFQVQWIAGGGRNLRIDKVDRNLTLSAGETKTTRIDTAVDIVLGAVLINGVLDLFARLNVSAWAFLQGPTPTQQQQDTITDLINTL